MNKIEFINQIAQCTKLRKRQVKIVLDTIRATIIETLRKGERLKLASLFTLGVKQTVTRTTIHPVTKQLLHIPVSAKITFCASKKLKAAIKNTLSNG